jgi:hypothetical protein
MRVMVFVKATRDSENGFVMTPEVKKMMEEMGQFNDELVKAGIMQPGDCEGLTPSSEGKRIAFDGPNRQVIGGPFSN